jgi:hypothetical protein
MNSCTSLSVAWKEPQNFKKRKIAQLMQFEKDLNGLWTGENILALMTGPVNYSEGRNVSRICNL